MAASKNKTPEFFEEESVDPMDVATGPCRAARDSRKSTDSEAGNHEISKAGSVPAGHKKKAGFYLSVDLLERFARKFYELKLAGIAIENKSALLEAALFFALEDLDKGHKSRILQRIETQ